MALSTMRIERWKIDEVRKYLEQAFRDYRIEDYPKGANVAHLFEVIEKRLMERQRVLHQLLLTRSFFDRLTEQSALRATLTGADVATRLKQARDRTVEIY